MSATSALFLSVSHDDDLASSEMASEIDSAAWPHFLMATWVHSYSASEQGPKIAAIEAIGSLNGASKPSDPSHLHLAARGSHL